MNLTPSTTGQQGIEILRRFRILRPDMPVIMITGWGTIPLAVEALNYGAIDFMTKPWSNADLVAKIKKALAKSTADKAAAEHTETLDEMERNAIREALRRCDGNMSEAAKLLGITRQSLYRRIENIIYEIQDLHGAAYIDDRRDFRVIHGRFELVLGRWRMRSDAVSGDIPVPLRT